MNTLATIALNVKLDHDKEEPASSSIAAVLAQCEARLVGEQNVPKAQEVAKRWTEIG